MMTRRAVLISGVTAAGALVVGYALWPSGRLARASRLAAKPGERFLSSWIKVADDDLVTVVVPHCDMGTGTFTALAQMAAEELDADWTKVQAQIAPPDPVFANGALVEGFLCEEANLTLNSVPFFLRAAAANASRTIADSIHLQTTGGSSALRMTGVYGMRIAAAAAREMLVKAAAARLAASPDGFRTEMSRVIHDGSGKSFGFGELAAAAARWTPSSNPRLKPKSAYRLIGRSLPRFDIPAKVSGALEYGIDASVPDLHYAAIKLARAFGGRLRSVREEAATPLRGVRKIVRLDDAIVVVADRFWRARNALEALQPTFDAGVNGAVSSQTIHASHRRALEDAKIRRHRTSGDGAAALGGAVIERNYNVPYLAHAPMEPVNATALYTPPGALEVWAGTQDALGARAFCAKTAGLPVGKVVFHPLPIGGAFGRRLPGQWNFLTYAVKTAIAVPNVPIKLLFTREEDIQHDFYRPNVTSRFRASLRPDGSPLAWVSDYTTGDDADPEAQIFYDVPNQAYGAAKVASPVPTGAWRSVASSWHGFFIESFVDELAYEAHRDPLDYRRTLLQGKPRHLAVLELAAEKSGWGAPLPERYGRGVAIVESFGTIVAHVTLVEVADSGALKVHRVTCAADCGMAINPDGFRAQIEGGVVFGLSAALYGAITIEHGAVVQRNFPDYPVVRLADCPAIEVHLHQSEGPLGGAGEPGTPPVAPSLTNAIFAATGIRIRELPVARHELRRTPPATADSI
ncbi:MAG TPA: molybdopterin cofactor-binding domain-containing protein [Steroidobacteraceae bacterium]|nr:molybdopterin cofactor-binding domain-containing protein [Steroidobacteraceae bacterium]